MLHMNSEEGHQTQVAEFSAEPIDEGLQLWISLVGDLRGVPDVLQGSLVEHTERESFWKTNCQFTRVEESSTWRSVLFWDTEETCKLLELVKVTSWDSGTTEPDQGEPEAELVLTRRLVITQPVGESGQWVDGTTALHRLAEERKNYFNTELIVPGTPRDANKYCVLVLVEHILLSGTTRLPGISITPLNQTVTKSRLSTLAGILESLAKELRVEVPGSLNFDDRDRHHGLVWLPIVVASSGQQAVEWGTDQARTVLDVIGLNRGDSPTPVAAAFGRMGPAGQFTLEGAATLGRRYRGNLMTGFLSGESTSQLSRQWESIQIDPRLELWLRLYNEATADPRWDYKAFRYFNLLEGIAKAVLPKRKEVRDKNGNVVLQDDGKRPYTSDNGRGAVYLLLEKVGHQLPHVAHEDGQSRQADLWEETKLWYFVRNEVAHSGSWAKTDETRAKPTWKKHNARLSTYREQEGLTWALGAAAESVIQAGLRLEL